MYIAVGNMSGKLSTPTKTLKVDAPLLFIPIVLADNNGEIVAYYDQDRRLEYNKDIIVALGNAFENNTYLVEDEFAKIIYSNDFKLTEVLENLRELYRANGFEVPAKAPKVNEFTISRRIEIGDHQVFKNATHVDID